MAGERDYSGRSRIDKLGVKPGHRVSVLGISEPAFLEELKGRGADVSGRRRKGSDHIFLDVDNADALGRMAGMEPWMARDGAVWVVYPRGRKELPEADVISAGVGVGLVDNKVIRFSDTHTALRFVIPLARR